MHCFFQSFTFHSIQTLEKCGSKSIPLYASDFAHMLASFYFQGHKPTITYLGYRAYTNIWVRFTKFGSDKLTKLHVVHPLYMYLIC